MPDSARPRTGLADTCRALARALATEGLRVVFAESCTSGLVAASLGRVPGVSEVLCGSAVTYRNDTKAKWIGVKPASLNSPGPVSAEVAQQMAIGVLRKTPEADLAASVTGHLGPDAPPRLDGTIFVAVAKRRQRQIRAVVKRFKLPVGTRLGRQRAAALRVLEETLAAL